MQDEQPQPLDRQDANSGTKIPDPALALPQARLERWMETHVPGFHAPLSARQFKGGQSNPTYLVTTPGQNYVLRRKPPGPLLPSAHAIEREFRVMAALGKAGFPVPRVHTLCEDDEVIGSAFFVMDHVEGRIFWEPSAPDTTAVERTAIFDAMNATMGALHTFSPEELNLADYGKPADYLKRQVARWSRQYRASQTHSIPAMELLMEWLPDNLPDEPEARLVHGDFRLDNLIIAPDEPRVLAVLDWELSTLGDPIADFTYHCMQWIMPPSQDGSGIGTLVGKDLESLGIPSLESYVASYEQRTGLNVLEKLDFYFAFNLFRLAAILQGIGGRLRDGTATSAHAQSMAAQTDAIAEAGEAFAKGRGSRYGQA